MHAFHRQYRVPFVFRVLLLMPCLRLDQLSCRALVNKIVGFRACPGNRIFNLEEQITVRTSPLRYRRFHAKLQGNVYVLGPMSYRLYRIYSKLLAKYDMIILASALCLT